MTAAPPPPPVGTSDDAGTRDDARARVFPCCECGADLEFSVDVQSLKCPYCGAAQPIEIGEDEQVRERDLAEALEKTGEQRSAKARKDTGSGSVSEVQCGSCAATVQFTGTLTSLDCPYCTTPIQLEGAHESDADRLPVDGVLPFQVDERDAGEALKAWVQSLWFAPGDFKRRGVSGKFTGVYLPYWTFDALTANRYRGERGDHYWVEEGSGDNKRRVRKTRWSHASGSFRRFFDDVLVIAGKGLPVKLLRKLEPWPLQRCLPFKQALLAGYFARTYDVPLKDGFSNARQRMEREIERQVRRDIGGDEQRVHSIDTNWGGLSYKHVLLPLWLMSYRYGDKIRQISINAATGEVQGERPWSLIKIAAAVVGGLAVAGGLYAAFGG